MGFLDRLLGRPSSEPERRPARGPASGRPLNEDEAAIERYRYLLRTAPPDRIEAAHSEAFATLTPEQRREVLQRLSAEVPAGERAASDDPRSLARMATRAEMRRPGTLERSFGGGGGIGMGGLIAGSLLSSVAGAFIGTAIADAMFDMSDSGDTSADGGDSGDGGGDGGGGGGGDGDAGGDMGDAGGSDFGDFGGGDFGGGDFGGFA